MNFILRPWIYEFGWGTWVVQSPEKASAGEPLEQRASDIDGLFAHHFSRFTALLTYVHR
jgi:hypothetical protein